jgi:hypothetical protein
VHPKVQIKSNETYGNTPNGIFHSQNRNTKDVSLQPTYIGVESTTLGKANETPCGWHWEYIGNKMSALPHAHLSVEEKNIQPHGQSRTFYSKLCGSHLFTSTNTAF